MFWVSTAWAFDAAEFHEEQPVQVAPEGFAFTTRATDDAAKKAKFPTYVVVYGDALEAGSGGFGSATENATELTWKQWSMDPAFDPKESILIVLGMDEREVRVRMGSRWDAELGLHNDALLPIIDANFMPLAVAQDYDGGLAALVDGINTAVENGIWWETYGVALGLVGLGGGGALAVATVGGFWAVNRRKQAEVVAAEFRQAVQEWRTKLDMAENKLTDLLMNVELRDQVLALKIKGERTKALLDEVTDELDELRLGIAALREHIERIEAQAKGNGSASEWRASLAQLRSEFEFDTGRVSAGLFTPTTEKIMLDPEKFKTALEESWAVALAGWERLTDAVEASLRDASADLVAKDLDEALEKLKRERISLVWMDGHPLLPDREAAWAGLDEQRRADPVAYLDALENTLKTADTFEVRVDWLLAQRKGANEARAAAELPEVGEHGLVFSVEADDPVAAMYEVEDAFSAFELALGVADPLALEAARDALFAACAEAKRRREDALIAVNRAPRVIDDASAKLASVQVELEAAAAKLDALRADHDEGSLAPALAEVAQAKQDLSEGQAALEEAKKHLPGRDLVAADRFARAALDEHAQAAGNVVELCGIVSQLMSAKDSFQSAFGALDADRARFAELLLRIDQPATELAAGDQKLAALKPQLAENQGPRDWKQVLEQVIAVRKAWSDRVSVLEASHAAARPSAVGALDWMLAGMGGGPHSGRSGSYRSSSSGSLFSSSRASGSSRSSSSFSSSRSGGSSFSSGGSRSAGRSFSSGGRSGGRKF